MVFDVLPQLVPVAFLLVTVHSKDRDDFVGEVLGITLFERELVRQDGVERSTRNEEQSFARHRFQDGLVQVASRTEVY